MLCETDKHFDLPYQTHQLSLYVPISCISCINVSQIMVATKNGRVIRLNWNGIEERDYALDLKRIPFSINQQVSYGKMSK